MWRRRLQLFKKAILAGLRTTPVDPTQFENPEQLVVVMSDNMGPRSGADPQTRRRRSQRRRSPRSMICNFGNAKALWLWRAVDQNGYVLDEIASARRCRRADLSNQALAVRKALVRRRWAAPMMPNPIIIIAQLAGSGTPAVAALVRNTPESDV